MNTSRVVKSKGQRHVSSDYRTREWLTEGGNVVVCRKYTGEFVGCFLSVIKSTLMLS